MGGAEGSGGEQKRGVSACDLGQQDTCTGVLTAAPSSSPPPFRFATAGAEGMHRALILRYVEVSAKLLVPITPHTSEHIWSNLLGKTGSVLTSGWPQADQPDFVMQVSEVMPAGVRNDLCDFSPGRKERPKRSPHPRTVCRRFLSSSYLPSPCSSPPLLRERPSTLRISSPR